MTDYYIVAIDDDGDVLAAPAGLTWSDGLQMNVTTLGVKREYFAFENQGDDDESKWQAARDALAAVIP